MNTEKFSKALGEIDPKYVEESNNYKKKNKRPTWIKWGTMAACLCLIAITAMTIPSLLKPQDNNSISTDDFSSTPEMVAAPGFLMVTAYAASSEEAIAAGAPAEEEVIMQEGIDVPVNDNWNLAMSSRPGIPLKLSSLDHSDLVFEISVDGGELLLWEGGKITHLDSPYNALNNTTVYWTSLTQTNKGEFERYNQNDAHITILIREGKNIVGYAVVAIHTAELEEDPTQTYYAKLLKSISFPKVNGKYQNVTDEYVANEIEQILQET